MPAGYQAGNLVGILDIGVVWIDVFGVINLSSNGWKFAKINPRSYDLMNRTFFEKLAFGL